MLLLLSSSLSYHRHHHIHVGARHFTEEVEEEDCHKACVKVGKETSYYTQEIGTHGELFGRHFRQNQFFEVNKKILLFKLSDPIWSSKILIKCLILSHSAIYSSRHTAYLSGRHLLFMHEHILGLF